MWRWLTHALYTLAPGRCILCEAPSNREFDLCRACENDLPFIPNPCTRCGWSLTHPSGACVGCLIDAPPWDDCTVPLLYASPIDRLIGNFKNRGELLTGRILAAVLADSLEGSRLPELLLPVPLHPSRQRERGFNQSGEIAAVLSRRLCIPVSGRSCQRVRNTPAQKSLHAAERRRNIRGAFSITGDFTGRHVAIVDDVVTTGATVGEIGRLLSAAGASVVSVIAIARTLP